MLKETSELEPRWMSDWWVWWIPRKCTNTQIYTSSNQILFSLCVYTDTMLWLWYWVPPWLSVSLTGSTVALVSVLPGTLHQGTQRSLHSARILPHVRLCQWMRLRGLLLSLSPAHGLLAHTPKTGSISGVNSTGVWSSTCFLPAHTLRNLLLHKGTFMLRKRIDAKSFQDLR